MKKYGFILALAIALVISASALAWYCSYCGTPNNGNYCSNCGRANASSTTDVSVYLTSNQRLSTRSGPGTEYSEPGSFGYAGESYKIISRCDIWFQVEMYYNGNPVRVYTGQKRFNTNGININSIPAEYVQYSGYTNQSVSVMSGPGYEYEQLHWGDLSSRGTVSISSGKSVRVYAEENNFVQIDFREDGVQYRGWVPSYAVSGR